MFEFGSGNLWAIPTLTLAGVAVTNPTPVPFGSLQDISIDMSSSTKELYGQYQDAVAVARGTRKITGKAKVAKITASLFNLVFGESVTTPAQNLVSFQESGQVPASSTYIVTTANNAAWVTDLGVLDATTMQPLTRVAPGAEAAGKYSVAAGVYTFASADASRKVKISYVYTDVTVTSGTKFTINNQLLGLAPYFSMTLNQSFQGKQLTATFNRVLASKLTLATKLEDFAIPELDFSMMADDSNVVGSISLYEF